MKKLLLILLIFLMQTYAQQKISLIENTCDNILCFSDSEDNIVSLQIRKYCTSGKDSCIGQDYVTVFSKLDGSIIKDIPLFDNAKAIYAFNISHDGNSFVIITSDKVKQGPYTIREYSLKQNKWLWENKWESNIPPLRVAYSEDDKAIIGVSTRSIVQVDAETGKLLKKSSEISEIGADPRYLKFDLSNNGKYFAFWWGKYLTWSIVDEAGGKRILDLAGYGIQWLFSLGLMRNHFYIWDIANDRLLDEVSIPYQTVRGTPAFTLDEQEILMDVDCQCKPFSLANKNTKDWSFEIQHRDLNIRWQEWDEDYKTISPDKSFLAISSDSSKIIIYSYRNGTIVKKFQRMPYISGLAIGQYAMAFDKNSEYFAAVTEGNKLCLFETKTWSKLWEKDMSKVH